MKRNATEINSILLEIFRNTELIEVSLRLDVNNVIFCISSIDIHSNNNEHKIMQSSDNSSKIYVYSGYIQADK